jgi:hypothetical protein
MNSVFRTIRANDSNATAYILPLNYNPDTIVRGVDIVIKFSAIEGYKIPDVKTFHYVARGTLETLSRLWMYQRPLDPKKSTSAIQPTLSGSIFIIIPSRRSP